MNGNHKTYFIFASMKAILVGTVIGLFLMVPAIAAAAEYVVSKSGNDSNFGSATSPFLTIQKAVSVARPGDVITVKPGIYNGARIITSGTSTAKITLRAEFPAITSASASRSVIKGSGTTGNGLLVQGQHWVIDGFEVSHFLTGIMVSTGGHFNTVQRSLLRGNDGAGITCWQCNDLKVEKNYFEDLGPAYPASMYAVMDYGVNLYYSRNASIIRNYFFGKFNHDISLKNQAMDTYIALNTFDGCMYQCIELGQNPDSDSEGDTTSLRAMVEYNVFRDAVDASTGAYYRQAITMSIMNVADVVIRGNYIENAFGPAFKVYYDFGPGDIRLGPLPGRAKIYGNTMVNFRAKDPSSGDTGYAYALMVLNRQKSPDDVIEVYNNTIVGRPAIYQASGTTVIQKNNLANDTSQFVGPLTQYDPYLNRGAHPVYQPHWSFNQPYRLISGSRFIDAGVNVGLEFAGAAPDIGSNEFIAQALSPAPAPAAPKITSGPAVSNITNSSAVITWYLSEPATGQVQYGLTSSYGSTSNLETRLMGDHVQVLSNLLPGSTYHYRVVSKNAAGLMVISENKSFTTTGTAPSPAPAPVPEPVPGPSSWIRCAVENGTCTFSGTRQVRYGYGDKWAYRTATGSIACNNNVFGDPYYGVRKVCDYSSSTTTTPSPGPVPQPQPQPMPVPNPSTGSYVTLPSTTYHLYVSTSGSDSNPGTQSAPLRTINRAAALAKPSTTVHVAPGTYAENINSTTSGTSSGYIYYVSDVKWGARIVPPASSVGANAWRQHGNYVWIVGFNFDGSSVPAGWRIGIWNSGSYVTVRDSRIHHVATGAPCNNNGGAGIIMSGYSGGRFHDILNNVLHHNGPKGCWFFHGIYMSSFDFNVKNNISYANASVGIGGNHDVGRGYIGNNTVFQNGRRGISLQGNDFYFASAGGPFIVENNLVYDNNIEGPFNDGSATGISVFGTLTGTSVIRNNYSANNRNTEIMMKSGSGSAYGNITTGLPGFVNYRPDGTGDYHLGSGSQLIDKGYSSSNTPLFDMDNRKRPQCSGFDIGAYEFPCP